MICRLSLALNCWLLLAGSWLRAADAPESFTLDLPFGAAQATPSWLGHPVTPTTQFATLDLPLTPPDDTASLLVTVFFAEKNGGFLRLSWQSQGGSEVLSDNFYEGIGMSNQRALLIPASEIKQAGALRFQCGDQALGISRIQLEWLEAAPGLVSPSLDDVVVTPGDGVSKLASDLTGDPKPADAAQWHDRIVTVPITSAALRIEQGVDFSVDMESVPAMARLVLKESGLPTGQHLVLWVNNHRASLIAPAAPDLTDAGYPDDKVAAFVGWRTASLLVPVAAFTAGANAIEFSAEPDDPTVVVSASQPPAPLAVKDAVLQLDYPVVSSTASTTATSISAASTPVDSFTPANLPDATAPAGSGSGDLLTPGAFAASLTPSALTTPAATNAAPSSPAVPATNASTANLNISSP